MMYQRWDLKCRPPPWSDCDGIWIWIWLWRRLCWRSQRAFSFACRSDTRCVTGCSVFFIVGARAMNVLVLQFFSRDPGVSARLLVAEVGNIELSMSSITHGDASPLEPIAYFSPTCIGLRLGSISTKWNLFNVLVGAMFSSSIGDCEGGPQRMWVT
jgi:hypothetical protein